MKLVAITKTYGEMLRTKENQAFPDEWPCECVEFDSLAEARAAYPALDAGRIMSIENYKLFSQGLALAHQFLPKPTLSWWQRLKGAL